VRIGSLFSGIGGLDLGLERAGMEVAWQVEIDPFCRKVLAKHWPDVPRYEDVHDVGAHNLKAVDLICAGFPCQPVSLAGKQLAQADERWLWPEVARIIRELRPAYVLLENVPGLLVRGLGDVLGDLAALRYDAEWENIPAAAFGAPHLRYRVFVVAYPHHSRGGPPEVLRAERSDSSFAGDDGEARSVADTESERLEGRPAARHGLDASRVRLLPTGRGEQGASHYWSTEPDVGRLAHGVPVDVARLRALGNAIVPQVAEWLGVCLLRSLHTEER
jgi:DNA (cytosine-5)-methyltransferase 1